MLSLYPAIVIFVRKVKVDDWIRSFDGVIIYPGCSFSDHENQITKKLVEI